MPNPLSTTLASTRFAPSTAIQPAGQPTSYDEAVRPGGAPALQDMLVQSLPNTAQNSLDRLNYLLAQRGPGGLASCLRVGRTLVTELISSGLMVQASTSLQRLTQSTTNTATQEQSSMMGSMSMATMLSTRVPAAWAKISDTWTSRKSGNQCDWLQQVLVKLQNEQYELEHDLPQQIQDALARADTTIQTLCLSGDDKAAQTYLQQRQSWLVGFPHKAIDISHQHENGDLQRCLEIDQSVKTLIAEYPAEQALTLSSFISQARANCFVDTPSRSQIYLHGAPGTGKTRFVQRLAQALGLPLVIIQPGGDMNNNFLRPMAWSSGADGLGQEDTVEQDFFGRVPAALLQVGIINPIVMIDEVSDIIKDQYSARPLKELLDPDTKSLQLHNLKNVSLDISRAIFVLAGNKPLEDAALVSRIKQVNFASLSASRKRKVVDAELHAEVQKNHRLGKKICDQMSRTVAPSVRQIMAEDTRCGVPGVRIAIAAGRDLISLHRAAILDGRTLNADVTKPFVRNAFAEYQPLGA